MPLTTDQGVCIRVWDWSETSQTVSIFSRSHGVLRCVAKGAKREKSPFSGGLEVMTRGEFVASLKSGDQLSILTAWDLQELLLAPRQSLNAFYHGMAMMDLVRHGVQDHDPHPRLFDSLMDCMRRLGTAEEDSQALLAFLWSIIDETGHRPDIWRDVTTGAELAHAGSYVFSPRRGGFVSENGTPVDGPTWRVRHETVELLRHLSHGRVQGTHPAVERATRLLALYFREVFAAEPPALRPWLAEPRSRGQ